MTSISNSMFGLPANWSAVAKLEQQMTTLQTQLGTGQKASTLADLGSARFSDLTVRSQLGRISGYDNNITTVNLRLNSMNNVLESISTINQDARDAAPGGYGTNNINLTTGPTTAQQQLDHVLTSLNTDINGHYLFGGGTTQTVPVASTDAIMNGSGGLDGFKTVAAQRLLADQGADGLGRLTLTTPAGSDTTTLAEDAASPFGLKLSSVGSSSSAVTLTQPNGTAPQSLSVQFTAQPAAGDTVNIGLKLPDGTTDSLTMKAVSGTPANPGEFQIGSTPAETAANFHAALQSSLQTEGKSTLAVASNYAAANGFFNQNGQGIQRAAVGPDGTYATATGYQTAAQTATDTVQWYQGESTANPRASVSTKVDDTTNVNYGVEANESGFTNLVRNLAVQSIQTYATTGTSGSLTTAPSANTATDLLSTYAGVSGGTTLTVNGKTITISSGNAPTTAAGGLTMSANGQVFTDYSGNSTIYLNNNAGTDTATSTDLLNAIDLASGNAVESSSGVITAAGTGALSKIDAVGETVLNTSITADLGISASADLLNALGLTAATGSTTTTVNVAAHTAAANTTISKAKFDAVASRTTSALSTSKDSNPGSLVAIGVDLGLAQTTLKNLSEQHAAYSAQLQDIIGNAETADPNLVASQLLQLQTQLSASFSATSMISQLQLVNYLK